MPHASIEKNLAQLEDWKRRFDEEARSRVPRILERLSHSRFRDPRQLIRFHEILLFLCAYPASREIREPCERLLDTFQDRVEALRTDGIALTPLDNPEVSGIIGTEVTAAFSFQVVRWLARLFPTHATIDWQDYDKTERLKLLTQFLPLLEEDAAVEANVPFHDWIDKARNPQKTELEWLIDCFDELPMTEQQKATFYNSLELYITTRFDPLSFSRTTQRLAKRHIFYHNAPLLRRKDVSIEKEFADKAIPLQKLSATQGFLAVSMARAASLVRYRELHGFTHGQADRVTKAVLGRGVEVFVYELAPDDRLPLRAYHAGMIVKNGIPIGYVETLSLFERCEVGFNLYYTFRDGESAWLYARLLRLFQQLFGGSHFSIDPYQIGFHNEEAIESGAFWFYRKLGFRPTRADILRLVQREEAKIARQSEYKTSAETLRKIADGHIVFEAGKSASDWDNFTIRKLGFAVQERLAVAFQGSIKRMRVAVMPDMARLAGINLAAMNEAQRQMFEPFAVVLSSVPDFQQWTKAERELVARIIEAKLTGSENDYLRLMQEHQRLREAFIRLGSDDSDSSRKLAYRHHL
jgi:hypothetical protein